jgi:phage terminase small subunit
MSKRGAGPWAQTLTDKESRFARFYASSLFYASSSTATDAAIAAGYDCANRLHAAQIASRARRRPTVAAAITENIGRLRALHAALRAKP